jgi:hypothetical protein
MVAIGAVSTDWAMAAEDDSSIWPCLAGLATGLSVLKSAGGDWEPPTSPKSLSAHFQDWRRLAAFEFRATKELLNPFHVSRVMTSCDQLSA